jgi:hypothetical protein
MIILVHGTGASVRDPITPHWWQPISRFSRYLVKAVGYPVCIAKPQRWTGLNSESTRTRAGAALLARLRQLDDHGISYHLIGHSHGGSVIWNALVGSAQAGRRLAGLRSWVTVGTPFLGFLPDPTMWWKYISLVVSGTALLWAASAVIEAWREQSAIVSALADAGLGSELYALFTIALLGAMLLHTASLFVQVARHLLGQLRHATLAKAEKRAAEWYGAGWLALWHNRDEAIAGLRASLVDPYPLWPRWAAAAASRLKRFVLGFHDRGFARAIDQFVWAVGVGRLQGADMLDQRMVGASHCPAVLSPGWAALPPKLAAAMTVTADSKAAATTAVFRERLATAGDLVGADQVLSSFGASVSWQELIHTSYFDQDQIAELIAGHIADKQSGATGLAADKDLVEWRNARAPGPETPKVKRARILAFPINRAIASATAGLLLLTAALSSYSASIAPYTKRALIDRIAEDAGSPALASVPNTEVLGDILVRLVALGRVSDFSQSLDQMFDRDSRRLAFNRLANAFGRNFPDTSYFLTSGLLARVDKRMLNFGSAFKMDVPKLSREDPIGTLLLAGRVYPDYPPQAQILSGLIDMKQKVAPELISKLVDNVETQRPKILAADIVFRETQAKARSTDDTSDPQQILEDQILQEQYSDSIVLAAADLIAMGATENADRLLDAPFVLEDRKLRYCPDSPAHIRRAAALGSVQAVLKLSTLCRSKKPSNDYLFEAAFAAHAAGQLEAAGELYDMTKSPLGDLKFSPRLWHAIALQIDRNKFDEMMLLVVRMA